MKAINESSGLESNVRFYSADGTQVTPTTAHWRLTDDATGEVILVWLAVGINAGADSYALVEIPGTLNTTRNQSYSIRRLTVAADRGDAREYSKSVTYRVNRLR